MRKTQKKNVKAIKSQKGITLLALVITIIVLLLLAGVSIMMLTGESGIFNQAIKAGNKTKAAAIKEQVDLWKMELVLGGDSKTEEEFLESLIQSDQITEEDINKTDKTITINDEVISYYTEKFNNI